MYPSISLRWLWVCLFVQVFYSWLDHWGVIAIGWRAPVCLSLSMYTSLPHWPLWEMRWRLSSHADPPACILCDALQNWRAWNFKWFSVIYSAPNCTRSCETASLFVQRCFRFPAKFYLWRCLLLCIWLHIVTVLFLHWLVWVEIRIIVSSISGFGFKWDNTISHGRLSPTSNFRNWRWEYSMPYIVRKRKMDKSFMYL